MLSEQQARAIVLALHDGYLRDGKPERFVVYFCELSANGDYWVVRSNSEDYVVLARRSIAMLALMLTLSTS
ncbi:hypothetical protein [Pseudomonas syringae group sp. J309-1]|uniref:hypothetical protein n=1 Tax=Pseudomonas syringae group sp. J309-1 TaxID=3079588 RepID=UPI002914619D|nr:hypothetical protein [Pseudomonas syringae group sp. J309-1]MDU8360120.1 hypothetical protein [Pseudomonas syringae group sp. J309-1]